MIVGHLGSSCLEAGTGVSSTRSQVLRGHHPGKYKVHSRFHPQHPQAGGMLLLLLLLSRFSRVRLCATPQTAAHQAPPSLGFSRQEYWSGVPLPSPRGYSRGQSRHAAIFLVHCSGELNPFFTLMKTLLSSARASKQLRNSHVLAILPG